MIPRGRWLPAMLVLVSGGVLALVSGCGDDDNDPTGMVIQRAPEEWSGIWSLRTRIKECGSSVNLVDTTIVQVICEGDSLSDLIAEGGEICAGGGFTGTASSYTFSCTEDIDELGCSGTLEVNLTTAVNSAAGTSTGSGRIEFNADVTTEECPDLCLDISVVGTRLGAAPDTCESVLAAPGMDRDHFMARGALRLALEKR